MVPAENIPKANLPPRKRVRETLRGGTGRRGAEGGSDGGEGAAAAAEEKLCGPVLGGDATLPLRGCGDGGRQRPALERGERGGRANLPPPR